MPATSIGTCWQVQGTQEHTVPLMTSCGRQFTLWLLAEMRDCQPPGQGEALLISSFSSSISSVKMLARLRAARRLSLLLYEYGGSTDLSVVVSPADPQT